MPNKEEILLSSQVGEDEELLLPLAADPELTEWLRDGWRKLELEENLLLELGCRGSSLAKKQTSSPAALKGLGELTSPKTLAWSLSSVITLLQLLSLEKRRPHRPVGEIRASGSSTPPGKVPGNQDRDSSARGTPGGRAGAFAAV